jgi:pimeloyl-ACP methyl ester carboxylesterase
MGAAIAIESAPVVPGICAVAAEASYATFDEIANDRISQRTGLGLWFPEGIGALIRESGLAYGRIRYHVWLGDADPAAALAHSRVPTLLICGTADDNIPMRHSLELYQAGRSHASLWIVPGAQHTGADVIDPAGFEHRVIAWFAAHPQHPASAVP